MRYRKLFMVAVVALAACAEGSAQNVENVTTPEVASLDKIWKQRKHFTVGFGWQKLTNLDDKETLPLKSSLTLSLQTGRTYNLHKKPLGNMVKIGLDWNQVELHLAKYKKLDEDDFELDGSGGSDEPNLGDLGLSDLGFYQLDYGMSVGPSIQVTPLYTVGNGWEFLKVYTHFHVVPSYSMIFLSSANETNLGYGYVTSFKWGIGVSYRSFAFGFERRWGKGKYNTSAFSNDIAAGVEDVLESIFDRDRTRYKTTSSRLTLGWRF